MATDSEIIVLYKKLGETPLQSLERLRADRQEYSEANMTYLGRLDPMAEGIMPVLVGNTRDKTKYLAWDKTYEFEVLWGFESDTFDILGLVATGREPQKLEHKLESLIEKVISKKTQSYPPYSSRTVDGKALFQWAREGRVNEVQIPERGIKIFSLEHIYTRTALGTDVLKDVSERVALVKGDFRQKEILKSWHKALDKRVEEQLLISKFVADVSTGTYIRSLAHEMGKILGSSALAYSIKRTRVGEYATLTK